MKRPARLALLSLSLCAPACDKAMGPGTGGADMAGGTDGPAAAAFAFDAETVDPAASGAAVGLVVDSKGAPHVLYLSGGDEMTCNLAGSPTKYRPAQLWHATRSGAGAFSKLAVSGSDAEVNGLSVALDPKADAPVVSYQGGKKGIDFCGGSDQMLGRLQGGAWKLTTVADKSTAGTGAVETSGDVVGAWSALAISAAGAWHLAWQDIHYGYAKDDFFKADLEYATGADGASLKTGESVQQDGSGVQTVMTLDRQGRPVLAYSSNRDGGVSVALRTGAGMFQATRLFSSTGPIGPAVATAPGGRLGLAYYDPDLKVLRFRESDDGVTWGSPDVVDRDGDVGRVVSLRYDSKGRPVLAYYSCGTYRAGQGCDAATDQLRVARREGELWQSAAVDDGGDGACGTALGLALSADDRIHVAYQCTVFDHASSQFKATVKYARQR